MESHKLSRKVFLLLYLVSSVSALQIELYSEKDRRGQSIKIDVSDNDCSELPLNWHNGVVSVDTLGNCVQFYDEPKCQGSLTVIQPFHIIHQMDLSLINYAFRLRTASPCGPKVKDGRYVIQNAADASVMAALNKHGNFAKTWTVNTTSAAAVPKAQQWDVVEKSNNEYFLKPRENSDNYPVSFDEESLKKGVIRRKVWKIMSVGRGRYIIKDSTTQRCLYKTDDHKVEEHSCRIWSTNQEWVFRTILGDLPTDKPKAQVGNGINFNILSKVATSRPPTKPPPQYYPIYFNATKLAQIKKFSTAAPYTIKKKIKRGPRPKTKYVEEPALELKPPGLRPAIPKHVASNNNFLLFKSPDGPAKDSYLPDFVPTDDIDILPTKEMIKNSKQYQEYVHVVKQYLAQQYMKTLKNSQSINKDKQKKKTKESEEEGDNGGEEEDEEETKENSGAEDDEKDSDESASEGTGEAKVTEKPPKKVKETYSSAPGSTGSAQDTGSGVIVESDRPGFMSKVFTKFKSNFAAAVPTVVGWPKLPSIPNVLPSLPSIPVPKLTLSFTKSGSSDKDKNESSQKENSSSRYTFNYSKYGQNSNSYEEQHPKKSFPFGRPGSRFFMRGYSSTTTKKPLTVGSWGIFG